MKTAANTNSTVWQNIRYASRLAEIVAAIEAHPAAPLFKLGALADKCREEGRPDITAAKMLQTLQSFSIKD
jgi:hypothetical protein